MLVLNLLLEAGAKVDIPAKRNGLTLDATLFCVCKSQLVKEISY